MKVLLINAKPGLVEALAGMAGLEIAAVWPRDHCFVRLPPPANVPMQLYRGGSKLSLRAAWQLRRLILAERPDVVHAFYGRALAHAVIATSGLKPRPRIISFRGITSPLSRANAGDWVSYLHPCVDVHACESEAVRLSLIASGIDPARCIVTFNSMLFPPARRPGRAALRPFGIPGDAFVVGTVGTFRRVKGTDLLLEAAIVCSDLEDVFWLFVGEVADPAVVRLAADPRIRARVRIVGPRTDASELISGANVFVMPSRSEALCQALLEAMHQHVCPIVSDAGGMKEVVRHGRDGLVVPAENASALAAAIRQLHADRSCLAQMAESAERRVADSFSVERLAKRTAALYEGLQRTARPAAA